MNRLCFAPVLALATVACDGPLVDAHTLTVVVDCGAANGTIEVEFPDHYEVYEGPDCGKGLFFGDCNHVPTEGHTREPVHWFYSAYLWAFDPPEDAGYYDLVLMVPDSQRIQGGPYERYPRCRFPIPIEVGAWQKCFDSTVRCRAIVEAIDER